MSDDMFDVELPALPPATLADPEHRAARWAAYPPPRQFADERVMFGFTSDDGDPLDIHEVPTLWGQYPITTILAGATCDAVTDRCEP